LIEPAHPQISISRQCELLGISRSGYYYQPAQESPENLALMRLIDREFTARPFYGSRRMTAILRKDGHLVNRKRIQRLMRLMGLETIYPRPKASLGQREHKIYPYLLRGVLIERVDQVWSTDITYIPMRQGFMYLVAVIDWFSRYVLSWALSNTLDVGFCLDALNAALAQSKAEIFNTDQGSQFTSPRFTGRLEEEGIAVSMDGRGRALDNVFVERLWRSLKYEDIYIKEYQDVLELIQGISDWFRFYNTERPHQALDYQTPESIYRRQV